MGPPFGAAFSYSDDVRHAAFALLIAFIAVSVGLMGMAYFLALAVAAWVRYDGKLTAKIF